MADNFNIAKFLKENSLGSYGILGKYVDLHALKEQDETVSGGLFSIKLDTTTNLNTIKKYANSKGISVNVVNPEGPAGGWPEVEYTGSKEALEGFIDKFYPQDADDTKSEIMPVDGNMNEEDGYGNNRPTQEVPYEDSEDRLDGFGSEFDQVDSVTEVEMGDSEMDNQNRMLGLIDTDLEAKLPLFRSAVKLARDKGLSDMAIFKMLSTNSMTKSSVDSLIDDGFAPEDVVDFFATDFTSSDDLEYDDAKSFDYGYRPGPNDPIEPNKVDEEVTVSSSGVEMGGLSEDIDIWQMAGDYLENFRNELASAHAMASQSGQREWVTALNKIALRLDALEGAMAEANAKLGVLPIK